ncbi:MAG: hypothetical protein WCL15_01000 [Actinomycetes bacterium]|jgi:hypothetical protein
MNKKRVIASLVLATALFGTSASYAATPAPVNAAAKAAAKAANDKYRADLAVFISAAQAHSQKIRDANATFRTALAAARAANKAALAATGLTKEKRVAIKATLDSAIAAATAARTAAVDAAGANPVRPVKPVN